MTRDRRQDQDFELTASAFAARFGVTPRALRVYEQAGLLSPRRTQAGWRIYGPQDADRLYKVLALKSLGLSLERIGHALHSADLSRILAAQEEALEAALAETRRGLELVRAARGRLGEGRSLSADDLVTLIKETAMTDMYESSKYKALMDRHFPPDLLAQIQDRANLEDAARTQRAWIALIGEGERIKTLDPASPEALDFGRRWQAHIAASIADPNEYRGYSGFFREGFADPELADAMPFSKELYDFVEQIRAHLEEGDGAV